MYKSRTKKRNNIQKRKTQKKGGKAISSSVPVELWYNGAKLECEVCKNTKYSEITASLGKSKLRSGLGQMMFGDAADVLDTTSVIIYICKECGMCKMIRNDNIKIEAR